MDNGEDPIKLPKAVHELKYGQQCQVLRMLPIRLLTGNLYDSDWHDHTVASEDDKAARTVVVILTEVLQPLIGDVADHWRPGSFLRQLW